MSLGDRLRQRRQEMGLTRPQLAAKICVTPSAIANYENGISTPKPDILISLMCWRSMPIIFTPIILDIAK